MSPSPRMSFTTSPALVSMASLVASLPRPSSRPSLVVNLSRPSSTPSVVVTASRPSSTPSVVVTAPKPSSTPSVVVNLSRPSSTPSVVVPASRPLSTPSVSVPWPSSTPSQSATLPRPSSTPSVIVLRPSSTPAESLPMRSSCLRLAPTSLSASVAPMVASSATAPTAPTCSSESSAVPMASTTPTMTSSSAPAVAPVQCKSEVSTVAAMPLSLTSAASRPAAFSAPAPSAPPAPASSASGGVKSLSPSSPLDLSTCSVPAQPATRRPEEDAVTDLSVRATAPPPAATAAQPEPELPQLLDLEDELGPVSAAAPVSATAPLSATAPSSATAPLSATAPSSAAAPVSAAARIVAKKNLSDAITPLTKVAQVAPRQPMGPPAPWRPRWPAAQQQQQQQRPSPSASPAAPWEPCVGVREGVWGEKLLTCDDCGLAVDTEQDKLRHRLQHHATGYKRACDQCSNVSWSQTQNDLHTALMHPSPVLEDLRCPDCAACFPSATMLALHAATSRDELHISRLDGHLPCPLCDVKTTSPGSLTKHMRASHAHATPFQCDELGCGVSYDSPLELQKHRKAHVRENSQQRCLACSLPFVTKELLDIHWNQVHPAPHHFVCPLCNKGFGTCAGVAGHVRRGHPGTKPFMCREPDCGRTFMCPRDLHEHASESRHMSLSGARRHGAAPTGRLQAAARGAAHQPSQHPGSAAHQPSQQPGSARGSGCSCASCPRSFPDSWSLMDHQDAAHMGLVPIAQVAHLLSLAKDAVLLKATTTPTTEPPRQAQRGLPPPYHATATSLPPGSFTASFVPSGPTPFGTLTNYPAPPAPCAPSSSQFIAPSSNSFHQSFLPPSISSCPSSSSTYSSTPSLPNTSSSYPQMHPVYPSVAPSFQSVAHSQQAQVPSCLSVYYNPLDYNYNP